MGWSVRYDVDIKFKKDADIDKIKEVIDGSWIDSLETKKGKLFIDLYEYDDHFTGEYERELQELVPYIEQGEVEFYDEDSCDYWLCYFDKTTEGEWRVAEGAIKYNKRKSVLLKDFT